MKRILAALLLLCLCVNLFCGCAPNGGADASTTVEGTTETTTQVIEPIPVQSDVTAADIAHLESLYEGLQLAYGDTHGHSASNPNSDGKKSFEEWKSYMAENQIDFATIVDHGQTAHMQREDWDDTVFIGGSEPGWYMNGTAFHTKKNFDHSLIFPKLEGIEALLNQYPKLYDYNKETGIFKKNQGGNHAQLAEIIQCIKDNGGMFVYVHPFLNHGYYDPVDPMNRWIADGTGFEVYNQIAEASDPIYNIEAYNAWVDLLNAGKRIWATHGSDCHEELPKIESLNTLYTAEKNADGYFQQLGSGNFTAGPVGIRIAVGDTTTGSTGSFEGNRVVIAVGDFHPQIVEEGHTYRVDVYDNAGLILSQEINTEETNYFAFDANAARKYYRANVYDVTADKMIATGNPVFNG